MIWWLIALCLPLSVVGDDGDPNILEYSVFDAYKSLKQFWLFRLLLNLLGYSTVIVPGYLLLRWLKNSDYLKLPGKHFNVFSFTFPRVLPLRSQTGPYIIVIRYKIDVSVYCSSRACFATQNQMKILL